LKVWDFFSFERIMHKNHRAPREKSIYKLMNIFGINLDEIQK